MFLTCAHTLGRATDYGTANIQTLPLLSRLPFPRLFGTEIVPEDLRDEKISSRQKLPLLPMK